MKLLQATAPLIFLLACSTPSDASVLDDVCHSMTNTTRYKPVVSYDYCVAFFQADKGSATADQRGLAAIGVRMIAATAKSTVKRIADLRAGEESSKDRLDCLRACAKVYSGAVDEINKAAKGIASGTGRALGDAATSLASALDAPLHLRGRVPEASPAVAAGSGGCQVPQGCGHCAVCNGDTVSWVCRGGLLESFGCDCD
ncbi:unnamed protein product [Urochloa humidicola]